jgi:hypothetical protein
MFSKGNQYSNGAIFALLFILPQVIVYTISTYNITNPFWFLYLFIVISISALRKRQWDRKMHYPQMLFLCICVGIFLSTLVGIPIGGVISRLTMASIAVMGYLYYSHNKMNPSVFILFIPALYLYFYALYFRYDDAYREFVDSDLFGKSSSNAIPIILNCVWLYYFIINEVNYSKKWHYWVLMLFAIINLYLIIVQGSRAGIAVAAIDILLVLSKLTRFSNLFFLILLLGLVFAFGRYGYLLSDIMDVNRMQGWRSLEENTRGTAQAAFFDNMTFESFLLGYSPNSAFGNETRTFNAFLDFWSKYGLFPTIILLFFFIKRFLKRKHYRLSLICFTPLLFYSLVESIWGGAFWDILIYILLFDTKNRNDQINQII